MISLFKSPCKSASALLTRIVRALPDRQPPAQQLADVTLLLEGTYPYVSGGVSSWVHQIIRGLPEIKFCLVFLGGDPRHYGQPKYKLPDNVTELQTHYLMEAGRKLKLRTRPGNAERFRDSRLVHQYFRQPTTALPEGLLPRFLDSIGSKDGIQAEDFLLSEAAWNSICEDYHDRCTDPSFLDYFWTVRMMHAPIFKIADIARRLPPSRIYHSVSTGYAGLLGAFLHFRTGRPFVITEHGIYTKERKIDLAQADWIKDSRTEHQGGLQGGVGYIRQLWIRFFEGIGRLSYQAADPIISLYEGNRKRQIKDGAPPERTQVIPNGIDLDRFAPLRARRAATVPKVLGLIGRVVPIKDIKTLVVALERDRPRIDPRRRGIPTVPATDRSAALPTETPAPSAGPVRIGAVAAIPPTGRSTTLVVLHGTQRSAAPRTSQCCLRSRKARDDRARRRQDFLRARARRNRLGWGDESVFTCVARGLGSGGRARGL